MSIYAYVGLPGSGKSYNVVANVILSALKEDRLVVTNIPVYEDKIRELVQLGELREFPIDKVQMEPALLEEYAPPGCVLVVDELWKLFPAGSCQYVYLTYAIFMPPNITLSVAETSAIFELSSLQNLELDGLVRHLCFYIGV